MLLAARNALRRGGLATGQQGMLHKMEECAAAAAGPLLPVWPGASANDGVRCSLPVPQPGSCGSRSLCITAEGGSRRASGAEASPHGHAAGAHAGHQAASSSGSSGGSAGEASAAEEDEEADARARETRQRILEAALRHVGEQGWTVAALQAGARECGLSPAAAALVADNEAGLVQYFVERCNEDLVVELVARRDELAAMRVPDRIRTSVRLRLEMLAPVMDTWPQALAIQARPASMPAAARALAALADDIWHAAGDTSTDYNWYTKRALLAGVIGTTELFMITDFSPGYADTWASLDRRLRDVTQLSKAASQVVLRQARDAAGRMAGGLAAMVSAMAERAQQPRPSDKGEAKL